MLLSPMFRYDHLRDAYVLRGVGDSVGPVLRPDRRLGQAQQFEGADRRRPGIA